MSKLFIKHHQVKAIEVHLMARRKPEEDARELVKEHILKRLAEDGSLNALKLKEGTAYSYNLVQTVYNELKENKIIKIKALKNPESKEIDKRMVHIHFYKVAGGAHRINDVAKKLAEKDFIERVVSVVGEWDIMVEFRTRDMEAYNQLLNEEIWDMLDTLKIQNSRGFVAIHTFKDDPKYFVEFHE